MCNFYSALVWSDGKIFAVPEATDSHSDLILAKGLDDKRPLETRGWVRIEFTPESHDDFDKPEKYVLKVDESSTPAWFDDAFRFDLIERLKEKIEAMIVRDTREILLGGCWILARGAIVACVQSGKIKAIYDGSVVAWGSSSVVARGSSRVVARESSSVVAWGSSSVVAWESSVILTDKRTKPATT